jgi:hypothetical protein
MTKKVVRILLLLLMATTARAAAPADYRTTFVWLANGVPGLLRDAWPLLHANGRVTNEFSYTVRKPKSEESPTPREGNALVTTVRGFLSTFAIRALPDYGIDAIGVYGVDFNSSYSTTYNNIGGISKPLLQMGLTGSYEYSFAEGARARAKSTDKTLAYVEGAVHGFVPCKECAVAHGQPADCSGDTIKTLYDYIDGWLSKPGRF